MHRMDGHTAVDTQVRRAQRTRRRHVALTWVVTVAAAVAAVAGGWFAWELWGTNRVTAREQRQLAAEVALGLHDPAGTVIVGRPTTSAGGFVETPTLAVPLPDGPSDSPTTDPTPGATSEIRPWGTVSVESPDGQVRIGPQIIVNDVTDTHLQAGPGAYPGMVHPGQPGNVGIAGHRVTYGAPFRDLGNVEAGWTIVLTDLTGVEHRYDVTDTHIVRPNATWVLQPDPTGTGLPTVTLTTCHPQHSNRERLIVHAVQR